MAQGGVLGFRTLLQRYCLPHFVQLPGDEALFGTHVVIDSPSLLGQVIADQTNVTPTTVFETAYAIVTQLMRLGKKVVLILDGTVAPGLEEGFRAERVRQIRAGEPHHPALVYAFAQAATEAGAEVLQAMGPAVTLCMTYARQHLDDLFAVVSNNADLFIFGVPRILSTSDLVVSVAGLTCQVYVTKECWRSLKQAAEASNKGAVTMTQRAQIAAILGTPVSSAVRQRYTARGKSPVALAMVVLQQPEQVMDAAFFAAHGLIFEQWSEAEQASFQAALDYYISTLASVSQPLAPLATTQLPRTRPEVVKQVLAAGEACVPGAIIALLDRGLYTGPVPGVLAAFLARVAPTLFVQPTRCLALAGDEGLLELCPGEDTAGVPDNWLAEVVTVDASAGQIPVCQATIPDTIATLCAQDSSLSVCAAFDVARVMHLLTPGADLGSLKSGLWPDGVPAVPSIPDVLRRGPRETTVFPDMTLDIGSSLSQEDWDSFDAKSVVKATKASKGFQVMNQIQSFDDPERDRSKPAMYSHQAQLLRMVSHHLKNPERPLHIIYSTPTGSGKTFSAVLLYKQLLHSVQEGTTRHAPSRKILVYSVPTKHVLKRVGNECEAHRVVYWTVSTVGPDTYEVRRPWSIRFKKIKAGGLKGALHDMLVTARVQGQQQGDRGRGRPDVIIADIDGTAALMEYSQSTEPAPQEFAASNLLLFYDEPNMGLHLNQKVHDVTRRIVSHLPQTAILASATMPTWTHLPDYWKSTADALLSVVTRPPHDLPICELGVFTMLDSEEQAGSLVNVSLLDFFPNFEAFSENVLGLDTESRQLTLLLRYLSQEQIRTLGLKKVGDDLADFRQNCVLPALMRLDKQQFGQKKVEWLQKKHVPDTKLRSLVSPRGITMVATLDPRSAARQLAGLDSEQWKLQRKKIDATISKVEHEAHAQKKQAASSARAAKTEDSGGPGQDEAVAPQVKLGQLSIDLEEAKSMDDETLVLLSKGIVYAHQSAHPAMMLNFQRAVLNVSETKLQKADRRPPLYCLVVDYASVYGLDCPAIETVLLLEDLGQHMTSDDLLQFLGRLRQDGRAIFSTFTTLCRAALGSSAVMDLWQHAFDDAVMPLLAAPPTTVEARAALRSAVTQLRFRTGAQPKGRYEVLRVLAEQMLQVDPEVKKLEPWLAFVPWFDFFADLGIGQSLTEQLGVLRSLYHIVISDPAWEPHGEVVKNLLITFYKRELITDDALLTWWGELDSDQQNHAILRRVADLIDFVKANASGSEEDDSEDEEEGEGA